MSASFVTFADLGKKKNLKTAEIFPVIYRFDKEKELDNVICRIATGFSFKNTYGSISLFFHFLLKLTELFSGGFFSARRYEEKWCDNKACEKINSINSDIVFFHPEYFYNRSLLSAKDKSITTVGLATMAHLGFSAQIEEEENLILGLSIKKNRLYNNLLKLNHNLNEFDFVIAYSAFVKNTYIDNGFSANKIFIAENDIDINNFIPFKKSDSVFRVLYIANTNILKGLHYLLDAWNSLSLKDAELFLVGGYSKDISPKLKKLYEEKIKSNNSIKWIGFTNSPEVYYKQTDIFVLPSLTEGNPRVVMEAMACGLPIITTENAKSIVEDGKSGFVVPIRDSAALQEKIKFLCYNRDRAEEMGKEARKTVESRKSFSNKVFEIYKEILKRDNIKDSTDE